MSEVLIFDFETLSGNARNAVILSCAAIACDWDDVGSEKISKMRTSAWFEAYKTRSQVEKYGLETSKETLEWWSKQSDTARAVYDNAMKVPIEEFAPSFTSYCRTRKVTSDTTVLCRGTHFDFVILEHLYELLNQTLPFNHWKVRDVRSIIDARCESDNGYVPGFKKGKMIDFGLVGHDPVDDCIKDLLQVKFAMTGEWD